MFRRVKEKKCQNRNEPSGSSTFIDCYGTVGSNRADSTILSAYDSSLPSTGDLTNKSRFDEVDKSYRGIYAITNLSTFGHQLELANNSNSFKTSTAFPRTNPNFRNFSSKSSSLFSENESEYVCDTYCKNSGFNVK